MKRIILLLSLITFFVLPLKTIFAQSSGFSCATITLTPTDGNGLNYYFKASDCTGGDTVVGDAFSVQYTSPDGTPARFQAFSHAIAAPNGYIDANISFQQNGSYQVQLAHHHGPLITQDFDIVGSTTIEITKGTNEGSNGDYTLTCGSPCEADTTCYHCPSFCPARESGVAGNWTCSASSPLCQNNTYDSVGVNSAIGCIPFKDASITTQFFIKWALGVGGGIGLFFIALSGIRIATTKGDPKRLQDARDSLTAAVVGIALIVLSIFLVRFISQTLLQLF